MTIRGHPGHRASEPVRGGAPEHGRMPRYYEVRAQLIALVREMEEGALLPPERALAERYGVSRVTLRQAVGELVLSALAQKCAHRRKYGHERCGPEWRLSGGFADHCHPGRSCPHPADKILWGMTWPDRELQDGQTLLAGEIDLRVLQTLRGA